jgi:hypothetical protein
MRAAQPLLWAAVAACLLSGCMGGDSMATGGTESRGKSGSLARFQVVGDYLYALSGTDLHVYRVADPAQTTFMNSVEVGWGIETLFPAGATLFVGSQTGMHAYDITDKVNPRRLSQFTHMRSCDPVVVEGGIAYLTLRSGNRCWNGRNELQIIDVGNLYQPKLLRAFPMANPHGLGIDGDLLFLCDGYSGLKVYAVGEDFGITLKQHLDGMESYDVIPAGDKLLIHIGKQGLYQYDYRTLPMRELSRIAIGPEP